MVGNDKVQTRDHAGVRSVTVAIQDADAAQNDALRDPPSARADNARYVGPVTVAVLPAAPKRVKHIPCPTAEIGLSGIQPRIDDVCFDGRSVVHPTVLPIPDEGRTGVLIENL